MSRRKPKKKIRVIYQSAGPLPQRIAHLYAGQLLVFTDASHQWHGGLAAVLFSSPEAEPIIETRTVPALGSNTLELHAVLFGLLQAEIHFPESPLTVFSDNLDAVNALKQAKTNGVQNLDALPAEFSLSIIEMVLSRAEFRWVKGHSYCRGNTLADLHAGNAAC